MSTQHFSDGSKSTDTPLRVEIARDIRMNTDLESINRRLSENGIFTLSLLVNYQTGYRRQCFGSLNAVDAWTAKEACAMWLKLKYGADIITFAQSKREHEISDVKLTYFHATLMVEIFTPLE